jgi:cytochrome c-type biogenesis protein CcmE
VAVGGCVVAVVAIVLLAVALSDNVVYFRTVSEAVRNRADQGTSRFRIAGGVVDG